MTIIRRSRLIRGQQIPPNDLPPLQLPFPFSYPPSSFSPLSSTSYLSYAAASIQLYTERRLQYSNEEAAIVPGGDLVFKSAAGPNCPPPRPTLPFILITSQQPLLIPSVSGIVTTLYAVPGQKLAQPGAYRISK